MGLINAYWALGGLAGAFAAGVPGGGTRSRAAFVLMAAALSGPAVLMLFVQRPPAAAAAMPPGRLSKPAGPVPAPVRAVRGGRLETF